jgi:N-acetyl-anhydromuramyl-L-alanine amidase AmpD
MILKNKFEIFAAYHPGHDRTRAIDTITIHGSAGGESADALFRWWQNLGKRDDAWSRDKAERMRSGIGFYHFLIGLDGSAFPMLPEIKWSYHSHAGMADQATLSICLVNPDKGNLGPYSDEQYHALHELIGEILKKYPHIKTIDSHTYRARKYSGLTPPNPCPGPAFQWERVSIFPVKVMP